MRKLALMLAQCLLLAGCTGLPQPREMGEMALLRTVGVDAAQQGVTLTVSTGQRASGTQGEEQKALILQGEGPSLSSAALDLRGSGDSYVFFGYVDHLLLGADPGSVLDVLNWFAQDGELGPGASLWLLRDVPAAQAVEQGGEEGVERRLSALELDAKLGVAPMKRAVGEVYAGLLDHGCTYLPALAVEEGPVSAGYAILKGDRIAGFLDGEAARGLELLAERPAAEVLEIVLPNNRISLRLTGAQLDCRPQFSGETLTELELTSRTEVKLIQWDNEPTPQEWDEIKNQVEQALSRRVAAALDYLKKWGTECVGIGNRVAIAAPGRWQRLEKSWQEVFPQTTCTIKVNVSPA